MPWPYSTEWGRHSISSYIINHFIILFVRTIIPTCKNPIFPYFISLFYPGVCVNLSLSRWVRSTHHISYNPHAAQVTILMLLFSYFLLHKENIGHASHKIIYMIKVDNTWRYYESKPHQYLFSQAHTHTDKQLVALYCVGG